MDTSLNTESENLIDAALTTAFEIPPLVRASTSPTDDVPAVDESSQPRPTTESADLPTATTPSSSDDSWKKEYESQVASWRAQSAEAREKAEKERERWEAIRAAEQQQEASRRKDAGATTSASRPQDFRGETGWEAVQSEKESIIINIPSQPTSAVESPIVFQDQRTILTTPSPPSPHDSRQDTGDESSKWEDVQASETSSFPSMTFPERTETPPPPRHTHDDRPSPLNATLAIFDPSLPTRTRVAALCSSLAINLLLPFINGVMLGFGEIFAKNVVLGWFGWSSVAPGTIAASTGIGSQSWRKKKST